MEPTLYILMRTDMDSMNPGKAMAQASHATNDFEQYLEDVLPLTKVADAVENWRDGRTFGRCLVLGATEGQIENIVDRGKGSSFPCGKIVDPTYPLQDGYTTHLISVMTCGWVFVFDTGEDDHTPEAWTSRKVLSDLKGLSLHP